MVEVRASFSSFGRFLIVWHFQWYSGVALSFRDIPSATRSPLLTPFQGQRLRSLQGQPNINVATTSKKRRIQMCSARTRCTTFRASPSIKHPLLGMTVRHRTAAGLVPETSHAKNRDTYLRPYYSMNRCVLPF